LIGLVPSPDDKPATAADQYKSIAKEFGASAYAHSHANSDEERKRLVARIDQLTLDLLQLALKHPSDPVALGALTQVVTQEYWLDNYTSHPGWGKDSRQAQAIKQLLRDHIRSDKLGETCKRVHFGFRQECETFLRAVLEKNPHREVQGLACLRLAQFLIDRRQRLELLSEQPDLAKRYEGLYGKNYLADLRRQYRSQVEKESERFYEQAIKKYGDVKLPYQDTIATQAKIELFEIRRLAVGKQAEEIEGDDQDGKHFKLSDYRGQVVLLYFWSEY
jgi:hypothetical protein